MQLDLVYLGSQDSSNQMNLGNVFSAKCSKLRIGCHFINYYHFQDLNQAEVLEGFDNINILCINCGPELRSIRCANLRQLSVNLCPT
jgi:hypothetical protein